MAAPRVKRMSGVRKLALTTCSPTAEAPSGRPLKSRSPAGQCRERGGRLSAPAPGPPLPMLRPWRAMAMTSGETLPAMVRKSRISGWPLATTGPQPQ